MNREGVWWAPPANRRPVILISRPDALQVRGQVVVAEVTPRIRGIPTEARLGPRGGMPGACVRNVDVIHTIYKSDLV